MHLLEASIEYTKFMNKSMVAINAINETLVKAGKIAD
jgi:hypothetical protein